MVLNRMTAALVGSRVPRDRTILVAGGSTSPAVLTEAVCKHRGNLIYFAVETRHEPTHFHQ